MATDSIRSPFYESHASLGATFMEEGGWYWTEGFGDADAEYHGVRDDLGVWDVSPLNKWEFRGPDSLEAAQMDPYEQYPRSRGRPGPLRRPL